MMSSSSFLAHLPIYPGTYYNADSLVGGASSYGKS
jgi:hypothetical protein